jgi:uncharacterized UPF0160 family protein
MTPKKAFKRIESVIELADDSANNYTATGRELEEAIIRINDDMKLVRKALTELEELKRVVKRYFDMEEKPCELHEVEEFYDLRDKLMKVGKEE